MKNFIKAHPYLSCTGLAVTTNALSACTTLAVSKQEFETSKFIAFSIGSLVFITLPSLLATAIDQYEHQNLFDNKPLQYGLTAVESVLPLLITRAYFDGNPFKALVDPDLENEGNTFIKCATAASLIQSLGFKYILDSANEQSEVETGMTGIEDILVIEM